MNHPGGYDAREPERDIPTIFEEEFFTLAKQLEQSIPDHFTRKFSGYGFLFLGYTLEDWQDRLIAYVLLKKWQNRETSICISESIDLYEWTFWKSLHPLDLFEVESGEFLGELHKQMQIQE